MQYNTTRIMMSTMAAIPASQTFCSTRGGAARRCTFFINTACLFSLIYIFVVVALNLVAQTFFLPSVIAIYVLCVLSSPSVQENKVLALLESLSSVVLFDTVAVIEGVDWGVLSM